MASPPAHEIIVVPGVGQPGREELRQQCYDVRIDVFHREQGFPLDTEIDQSVASRPTLDTFLVQRLTLTFLFLASATAM